MDYSCLLDRVVRFTIGARNLRARCGTYYGMVRRVNAGKRAGLKSVTVQRASSADASTLSARYRGEKLVVSGEDLNGVYWYGRVIPLDEYLRRQA